MDDIPNISKRICDSCGRGLPDGELFYHCRTELVAAKDASIPDLKHPDRLIAQALSEIAGKEESELLDDIYQELILQLCPDCRMEFLKLIHTLLNKGCKNCPNCGPSPMKKKGKLIQFSPKDEDE
jgi:protein-arginine kinase activator protein McsA